MVNEKMTGITGTGLSVETALPRERSELMIRLFTAIALPVTVCNRIAELQSGLPGARWVPIEQMHVTLRFIGEVHENVAGDIDEQLSALRARRFRIALEGLGAFGAPDPHVLWAGVRRSEALSHLAQKIETILARLRVQAVTRRFTPQVTIARLKNAPQDKVVAFIQRHNLFSTEEFEIAEFGLYASLRGGEGPHYELERSYSLG